MENKIIDKKEFCSVINEVKSVNDYHDGLNTYFREHGADGYLLQPDCAETVIKLLHSWFGKADTDEWISYFCWELDFGRKYESGCITDSDGIEIKLTNAEELYDLLMRNMEDNHDNNYI